MNLPKYISKGEVRLPSKLAQSALAQKLTKPLRIYLLAKLEGHRANLKALLKTNRITPRTGRRAVKKLEQLGWANADKKYLFTRSWRRLAMRKRGGTLLTPQVLKTQKKFDALLFAMALKRFFKQKKKYNRSKGGHRSMKWENYASDFPASVISAFIGISDRRFRRLKLSAQKYRFITSKLNFTIIGPASDSMAYKNSMQGYPVFKKGRHTVVPMACTLKVKI